MPYRDELPACLDCATSLQAIGERRVCPACGSLLVPVVAVEEMLQDMTGDGQPLAARLGDSDRPLRPCPCCQAPMTAHTLTALAIDLCATHGIWFDRGELEAVLRNAPAIVTPPAPRSAGDVAADVVGGGLGVLEIVLEIVASL